ncbi:MAG: molybdopterin-binding protein [Clostridia bacterium]|nr:molybdopterin-binding protein [Clostridia bacterium]
MIINAAVITVSDKGFRGEREDTSGPMLCRMLEAAGYAVVHTEIVPDEYDLIRKALMDCADERNIPLVLTTGGTGFAPRDVTPEATMSVVERETPGIPEAMRAESMKITPRGCLSRCRAGIRKSTLIINLPGSERAARENFEAVLPSLGHGLKMLASVGSAECAVTATDAKPQKKTMPSVDMWLKEAKTAPDAGKRGMYLTHNGVVRETPRAAVREGATGLPDVAALEFGYDAEKVAAATEHALAMPGISYARVWLNEGVLDPGDDMMLVLVGGDIRPHVIAALEALVGELKTQCVTEREIFA